MAFGRMHDFVPPFMFRSPDRLLSRCTHASAQFLSTANEFPASMAQGACQRRRCYKLHNCSTTHSRYAMLHRVLFVETSMLQLIAEAPMWVWHGNLCINNKYKPWGPTQCGNALHMFPHIHERVTSLHIPNCTNDGSTRFT
jgi:hypothetical protein